MRRNRSQTAQRRSHHALTAAKLQKCECGALRQSHRACPSCGKYNGRVAIDVVGTAQRNARRTKRREKELMASGQITPDTKKKDSKKEDK
jgi:large subunit ribosomal protein L32